MGGHPAGLGLWVLQKAGGAAGEGARWRWGEDTAEASALETLRQRSQDRNTWKQLANKVGGGAEPDVPYMVCVWSGYCVVEEETRLGWPCVGGAIILALPCITGLNTCCA